MRKLKLMATLTATVAAGIIFLAAVDSVRAADSGSKDAAKMSTKLSNQTKHKQKPMLNPQPLPPGSHSGGGGTGKARKGSNE